MLFIIKIALILASWLLAQGVFKVTGVAKEAIWVGLLTAVLGAALVEVTDRIESWWADPQLAVMVEHPEKNELLSCALKS